MRIKIREYSQHVIKFFHWLNQFAARHVLLLAGIVFIIILIHEVPQVSYAFGKTLIPSGPTQSAYGKSLLETITLSAIIAFHVLSLVVVAPWDLSSAQPIPSPQIHITSKPSDEMPSLGRRTLHFSRRIVHWVLSWPSFLATHLPWLLRIGVLIALVFIGFYLVRYVNGWRMHWYPLADLHLINFGWMSLALSLWLLYRWFVIRHLPGNHYVVMAVGKLVGWLLLTYFCGEAIWAAANIPALHVDYLRYTQWAMIEIVFLLLMLARVIDYWDNHSPWPIRLFGLTVFCVGAYIAAQPVKLDLESNLVHATLESPQAQRDEWIACFKARLNRISEGPVIFVAASGGGSRAAIFASLVLEGMAREQMGPKDPLASHILMISSVSGGSLATADAFARCFRGGFRSRLLSDSGQQGLCPRIVRTLEQCIAQLKSDQNAAQEKIRTRDGAEKLRAEAWLAQIVARIDDVNWALEQMPSSESSSDASNREISEAGCGWILSNEFSDEMCLDFMAPILRGAMTPGIDRARALELFWEEKLGWGQLNSESVIAASTDSPAAPTMAAPLVLFNSSKVSSGARFIIGFPPLPKGMEFRSATEIGKETSNQFTARNPPVSPADLPIPIRVSLAQAVRLSASFPWGLPVTEIEDCHLLDGGIVDNTGIDSICEVLDRLSKSGEGRQLLAEIAMRGVVLLEIDSGGKPMARAAAGENRGFLEPLDALNNAAYTNADFAKERYREQIQTILTSARREWIKNEEKKLVSAENRLKVKKLAAALPPPMISYPFQCEHFQPESIVGRHALDMMTTSITPVMTAWALPDEQKARVMSRFLIETAIWHGEVGERFRKAVAVLRTYAETPMWITTLLEQDRSEQSAAASKSIAARVDTTPRAASASVDVLAKMEAALAASDVNKTIVDEAQIAIDQKAFWSWRLEEESAKRSDR